MPRPDRLHDGTPSPGGPAHASPSLGDALAWLGRHVNLEAIEANRAGRAGAPDLSRVQALVDTMGNPERSYPVLHITGTNGKGSTTRMVAALLEAMGLTVGTYTSPDLEAINERISVAGVPIADDDLAELFGVLEELERFLLGAYAGRAVLTEPPTRFELLTAAAYRHFADVAVQAAVVEVGLGGRYDATNVAAGQVAVVTNVALDHQDILGPTRAQIAAEKAGIVKPGAVVVVGEADEEIQAIFAAEAERVGAEAVWRRGVDFACEQNQLAHGGRLVDIRTPGGRYRDLYLPLHGAHQGENAACALAAAEAFFGGPLEEAVVAEAFAATRVPGRLEVVARHPLVLLDGAHNTAGAEALGAALAEDFSGPERVIVVMGCLRGRDPADLLAAIVDRRVRLVVGCRPPSPRGQPPEAVTAAAAELGIETRAAEEVAEALALAREAAGEDDLVLVTGSIYVVGEARRALRGGR